MLKYLLTAIYLGLLACVLYQPISIPDDDSMIDKYRPSLEIQSTPGNTDQSLKNNQNIAIRNTQKDSINFSNSISSVKNIFSITSKEEHILVDSTP